MSLCSLFLITHYLYHSINPCLYPTDIPTILFFVNLSLFKIPSWHPHTWHNHHRLPKVFFVFCMEEDGVHYGVLWYVIEWQLRSVETWGQDSKKVKLTECVLIATKAWIVMLMWQTYYEYEKQNESKCKTMFLFVCFTSPFCFYNHWVTINIHLPTSDGVIVCWLPKLAFSTDQTHSLVFWVWLKMCLLEMGWAPSRLCFKRIQDISNIHHILTHVLKMM